MRRLSTTILVLFILLPTVQAQTSDCPLKIENSKWSGAFYGKYYSNPAGSFSIEVRNLGTKTVKLVEWHFYLIDSVRGDSVVDHLTFTTDNKPVKPGQTWKFSKHVEIGSQSEHMRGQFQIVRVVFEDGSEWKYQKKE